MAEKFRNSNKECGHEDSPKQDQEHEHDHQEHSEEEAQGI